MLKTGLTTASSVDDDVGKEVGNAELSAMTGDTAGGTGSGGTTLERGTREWR